MGKSFRLRIDREELECLDWADWSRELTQGHNVVIGGSSCPAAIDRLHDQGAEPPRVADMRRWREPTASPELFACLV